jgi:hypothetical protein
MQGWIMCFRPWYKSEQGVETRRALGLMGALASVSQYAAQYMSGKCTPAAYTEGMSTWRSLNLVSLLCRNDPV